MMSKLLADDSTEENNNTEIKKASCLSPFITGNPFIKYYKLILLIAYSYFHYQWSKQLSATSPFNITSTPSV